MDTDGSSEVSEETLQLRETVDQLSRALSSRIVIEQAKGLLAERLDLSLEEAFAILRYAARATRMDLHELSASVIADRTHNPDPIVLALKRLDRWRDSSGLSAS